MSFLYVLLPNSKHNVLLLSLVPQPLLPTEPPPFLVMKTPHHHLPRHRHLPLRRHLPRHRHPPTHPSQNQKMQLVNQVSHRSAICRSALCVFEFLMRSLAYLYDGVSVGSSVHPSLRNAVS